MGAIRMTLAPIGLAMTVQLVGAAAPVSGDEETPEALRALLSERGLTFVGREFLLDEGDAVRAYREAEEEVASFLGAHAEHAAILGDEAAIDQANSRIGELQRANADLKANAQSLERKYGTTPIRRWNAADRNAYKTLQNQFKANRTTIDRLVGEIKQARSRLPKPQDRKRIEEEFTRQRSSCRMSVERLSGLMEPLALRYRDLEADREVKDAVIRLNALGEGPYRLGPSKGFTVAFSRLQEARQALGLSEPEPEPEAEPPGRLRRGRGRG
ncbi:hypothetical protein [Tautonia plasticadhaerens]|uniref:Chromosome partition protein Smc n=1 Tax=Tautonia plasticadhaerens TaxID=2527974 RepID=A0A518HAF4_9BACT|nr:hypothetical protein [Tautonia plasticadhaerens]QDV37832.1 hypothetical protein ElP_57790 [Tautonia plasticadhaerens]